MAHGTAFGERIRCNFFFTFSGTHSVAFSVNTNTGFVPHAHVQLPNLGNIPMVDMDVGRSCPSVRSILRQRPRGVDIAAAVRLDALKSNRTYSALTTLLAPALKNL